jgi:aryl-alcohol dehydrogenase-like predicted oxidoreductase
MQNHALGQTGFQVSAMGLSARALGAADLPEADAAKLLHQALDLGVSLIDVARSDGLAEERIGRHLARRRGEFILSTKGGYGVEGVQDGSPEAFALGINRALRALRTDHIDLFHLHACSMAVLQQERIWEVLELAREQGKIGAVAYTGDGEPLGYAVASGLCGAVETTVNPLDQASLRDWVPLAQENLVGVIAKRTMAAAVWRLAQRPAGPAADVAYWDRFNTLLIDPYGLPWDELFLRFAAFAPGVSAALVSTRSLEHLKRAVAIVEEGPLPSEIVGSLVHGFDSAGGGWPALV